MADTSIANLAFVVYGLGNHYVMRSVDASFQGNPALEVSGLGCRIR